MLQPKKPVVAVKKTTVKVTPKKKTNNDVQMYKGPKGEMLSGEGFDAKDQNYNMLKKNGGKVMKKAKTGSKIKKAQLGDMLSGMGGNLIGGLAGKALGGLMGKNGKTVKKSQGGSSLGMKSVKAGFDKNPGVTRADIIVAGKGKAKSGAKMKMGGKMAKQAAVAIAMKKAGKTPKKMQYGGKAASMVPMKAGGAIKKAQDGNNVVPRNLNKRQYERVTKINETSRDRANKVANRISDRRNARGAENPRMNGDVQFNMKSGGKMKTCKGGC